MSTLVSNAEAAEAVKAKDAKEASSFFEIIQTLNEVPKGRALIKKSLQIWKLKKPADLAEKLDWGKSSRTDTTLTRHFNPVTGKEDRERQVKIFIKEDQPFLEKVLDFSHELVHATSQPGFDPYDPQLTAAGYIYAAIEGKGGEVEAVLTECEVGFELSRRFDSLVPRCQPYFPQQQLHQPEWTEIKLEVKPEVKMDQEKIRRDFYRVGNWLPDLVQRLNTESNHFPLLSSEEPQLYSSTGHTPYPFALLKEFDEITDMACNNSKNRIKTASSALMKWSSSQKGVQNFISKRCQPR